ncbi:unnamed protein product [Caenorhabditis auriculariae]|uniref:Uncharacterized protein n=1 Tax=Caenorhabditis auriculariae TaxID=2777116 RepID=A0A8S1GQX0_9PELO|nr:unnamed protein product [Caenorhabditis auriculariae]
MTVQCIAGKWKQTPALSEGNSRYKRRPGAQISTASAMNYFFLLFALALLSSALCGPNRYGFPDSYERYLERQGAWDFKKHEVRGDYGRRGNWERDLRDLFEDWKKETHWGRPDYRSSRFQAPRGGYGRYGFSG